MERKIIKSIIFYARLNIFVSIIILFFSHLGVFAAGTVSDLADGLTKQDVLNKLLGTGITVSNLQYSGHDESLGIVKNVGEYIGFDDGIILGSGYVENFCGDNNFAIYNLAASTILNTPGDSNLNSLVPGYFTKDASVLEFDFVPKEDLLTFSYVFSSEEYYQFVYSSFNDVFGFFLDGQNIALIPGTEDIVSINTINGGTVAKQWKDSLHSELFVTNYPPFENPNIESNIKMNGFTKVLEININVIPGKKYHIKLAIADVHDHVLDSNVILCANSFSSNRGPVANAGLDQTLISTNTLTNVSLDGSLSCDDDGDILQFKWNGPFGNITGKKINVTLPIGTHTITLVVNDGENTSQDTVVVTVIPKVIPTPIPTAVPGPIPIPIPTTIPTPIPTTIPTPIPEMDEPMIKSVIDNFANNKILPINVKALIPKYATKYQIRFLKFDGTLIALKSFALPEEVAISYKEVFFTLTDNDLPLLDFGDYLIVIRAISEPLGVYKDSATYNLLMLDVH